VQHVSGITFIRYTQSQNNLKPNNSKSLGARKPRSLARIAKISYSHLCLREENYIFNNNYMI